MYAIKDDESKCLKKDMQGMVCIFDCKSDAKLYLGKLIGLSIVPVTITKGHNLTIELNDGSIAKDGDVIYWDCWDEDDHKIWEFEGVYVGGKVIYLGGGSDYGTAKGKLMTVDEVINESLNHDVPMGIRKKKVVLCCDCNEQIDHETAPQHDCIDNKTKQIDSRYLF
jgi:hypothetical protein